MQQAIRLADWLCDLAVVRTTFETLALFPADDPIRTEMLAIAFDAREQLVRHVQMLCDGIQTDPVAFPVDPPIDYEKVKACALDMMERGYPGVNLNRFMKVQCFDEGESSLYYLEVAALADLEAARQIPPQQFTVLLFRELLHVAGDQASYADAQAFDCKVYRKFIAVLFICYATIDGKEFW